MLALEGSPRRARITAARCQGLSNVTVVCDNFSYFEGERKFDAVIAVGVLEYAPSFFGGEDPVHSFLTKARGFLKPSGSLFVAIENQLGLKYFSGCAEDHTGNFFYGIEDRYQEDPLVVTFGRAEFRRKLRHAGFARTTFFYPFPDYKLPRIIFTEAGLTEDWDVGQIIGEFASRDYRQAGLGIFSEQAAWPMIHRNLLTKDLSNSFLVLASIDDSTTFSPEVNWLAKAFSSYRKKNYRTVTTFKTVNNTIKVAKQLMYPELPEGPSGVARLKILPESNFVHGETLHHVLVRKLVNPKTDFADMVADLAPWGNFLKKNLLFSKAHDPKRVLPGDFIDCVPWNLICGGISSDPIYFDAEWEYLSALPVEMPLVRGLLHLDIRVTNCEFLRNMTVKELIIMIGDKLGFSFSEPDLDSMIELAAEFSSSVTYRTRKYSWSTSCTAIAHPYTISQTVNELIQERDWLRSRLQQLNSMLNSRSWKITSPLRKGYDSG